MEKIKAYIALTKPRVIELLLVATIPAMLQADRGHSNIGLILLTLLGGWMGAAAANTFNMVADSDIDQKMGRTRARPLVKHTVSNRHASIFAWILTVTSFLWLWLLCDSLLAGLFVMLTIFFYIFVYTKHLKRKTHLNIVWGGAAGCMPVVVGWAVITDNAPVGTPAQWWQAIVLFLIIFFWTPPHTWALAMKYKDDYARAGVPMLPVVREPVEVTRQIVWYTWATVITTFLIIPAAGWIYGSIAVISGIWFLIMAIRLHQGIKAGGEVKPLKLFILSNNYLSILFVGLSLDAVLGLETVGQMLGWVTTFF
ncbi:heme o synthase [Corynebacterium silvaticum]|uniref:Protoheme IX farnesyltransferase n=1 Tax=Corynebacterium silvaticum TaxID=2320431 RepID=A0A7Y4LGC2_9CORY|nr:heme o synthase [Corynebacterium silvaticum]ARU46201.1 heme o synthase [Corynebacterium silvaticum]MBH5299316.1 protoheme IX farnesyltransferase [Corynebacterium silvaticum]NOM64364.1 protoheme IX farnesyltransferase [Corynebacterium silvaticum]NON69573.1 protoheme IX farnesyltransferase [Corynebacterium silvaticum]TFA94192.1 protoheme IX farnesyltransferase [Corynebacterium silvaticum]